MKKEFITNSAKETYALAMRLGNLINSGCVIAFKGDLGSGKTCFTTGLAKGLEYCGEANSPTFAIVNEYLGGRLPIYHFDMYRIADEDELYSIGFYDYLDADAVLAIEWSENVEDALPSDTVFVIFSNQSENSRTITFECTEEKAFLKEL